MTNRYNERNNYIDALPSPVVRRVEILPPEPGAVDLRSPVEIRQELRTSAVDRAKGFNISTAGLAAMVGVGGVLLAVVGWQMPLFSLTALTTFFTLAMGVWLIAWAWYNLASPDGVGVLSVLLQYRLLRHEQRARLDRIDAMMDGEE
jgi:hypothetical protein